MRQTPISTVSRVSLLLTMVVGATGCLANILPTIWPPCHEEIDASIERASKEFSCPPEKIGVIWRTDLSEDLFDLAVCGHRARYTCFSDKDANRRIHCIHEPDPASWQPDPLTLATLPRPKTATRPAHCHPIEARRICRNQHDFDKSPDCILPTPPVALPQGNETRKAVPETRP